MIHVSRVYIYIHSDVFYSINKKILAWIKTIKVFLRKMIVGVSFD